MDSVSVRRLNVSDLYWLTDEQMARLESYFPKSHGKPRVDDRRVLSGIIFVSRNGLRWRDAPRDYGPHKTFYNRWKRWGDKGVFTRFFVQGRSVGSCQSTARGRVPRRGVGSDGSAAGRMRAFHIAL